MKIIFFSGFCRRHFSVLGREHPGCAQGDPLLGVDVLPGHPEDGTLQASDHHPEGHVQG